MEAKYTFNEILRSIAEGMKEVTIKFPDVQPIKGIIQTVDLTNTEWKPFFVKFIDSGLQIEDTRWVEKEFVGEVKEKYQRPYTEDWVHIQFITYIQFETDKQIELKF